MIRSIPQLNVIMYHYVRDLPNTRFPRIHGMLTSDFRRQVAALSDRYEMATLQSALDFLKGTYSPRRNLCLLTFDDALYDHFSEVSPVLVERKIQGVFFLPTQFVEQRSLSTFHKSHLLMATLDFETYKTLFLNRLADLLPQCDTSIDPQRASYIHKWDSPQVASFKYLLKFRVPESIQHQILDELFQRFLGDESDFANELYLSWDEARAMQRDGMVMGGHSHGHTSLARLDEHAQRQDILTCSRLLRQHLHHQAIWPFSYPYGKPGDSFDALTEKTVSECGFTCAFTTEVGDNRVGQAMTRIRRFDTKDACS